MVKEVKEFEKIYNISITISEYIKIFNAAPTMKLPVMLKGDEVKMFRWGLIPHNYKGEIKALGGKFANGRAETIDTTYPFKDVFGKNHCLVLADSFFEWDETTKPHQPYRFMMKDEKPFFLAGIYDNWADKKTGEFIQSFSLITTEPNDVVARIHDRMPVIIPKNKIDLWLDTAQNDVESYLSLLTAYPAEEMKSYAVSTELNNARNNYPELLEPVEPQKGLFSF